MLSITLSNGLSTRVRRSDKKCGKDDKRRKMSLGSDLNDAAPLVKEDNVCELAPECQAAWAEAEQDLTITDP